MTLTANHGSMFACQLEGGTAVIKSGWRPTVDGVTAIALIAKPARVRVILCVAGGAVLRRAFKDAALMAFFAGNRGMFSIEVEGKGGVIHFREAPAFGVMAYGAVGSKLSVVMVILCMAGVTILRGGF